MRVTGRSMEPALHEGDYVLVNRLTYLFSLPHKNDIVVVRHPVTGRLIIKRVVRITGERYFVQGDHSSQSTDSRMFGAVAKKHIVGKVWKIIKKK